MLAITYSILHLSSYFFHFQHRTRLLICSSAIKVREQIHIDNRYLISPLTEQQCPVFITIL